MKVRDACDHFPRRWSTDTHPKSKQKGFEMTLFSRTHSLISELHTCQRITRWLNSALGHIWLVFCSTRDRCNSFFFSKSLLLHLILFQQTTLPQARWSQLEGLSSVFCHWKVTAKVFLNDPNCTHRVNGRLIYGLCLLPAGVALKNGKPCTAWRTLVCTRMLACARICVCQRKRARECVSIWRTEGNLEALQSYLEVGRHCVKGGSSLSSGNSITNGHNECPVTISWEHKHLLKCHKDHHMKGVRGDIFVSAIHLTSLTHVTYVNVYEQTWQTWWFSKVSLFNDKRIIDGRE